MTEEEKKQIYQIILNSWQLVKDFGHTDFAIVEMQEEVLLKLQTLTDEVEDEILKKYAGTIYSDTAFLLNDLWKRRKKNESERV